MVGGGGITSDKEKEQTVKAISKLAEKLKTWVATLLALPKVNKRLGLLRSAESEAWQDLEDLYTKPQDVPPDVAAVISPLNVIVLSQKAQTSIRVNALLDAFSPQLNALPVMLRAALELSSDKKPSEQALLRRFFDSGADGEAAEAGVDLVAALFCREEGTHPVDPEITALQAEGARLDEEISKLRDAAWYRSELEGKRQRLAGLQAERAKRPEAEVQDTEMLRLIPHYLEQQRRLQALESKVAASPAFDAVDKALGELVVIASLAQWRDGSPGSLDGLLKVIYRHPSFTPLHNSVTEDGAVGDVHGLLAAVLNVHTVAREVVAREANPGVRFTLDPDNRVVGVWSLPGEVQAALYPAQKAESVAEAFDATKP